MSAQPDPATPPTQPVGSAEPVDPAISTASAPAAGSASASGADASAGGGVVRRLGRAEKVVHAVAAVRSLPFPPTWADLAPILGTAKHMRHMLNVWPTFLGAGVRVEEISDDFRHVVVRLRLNPLTANYVGTAFGGTLFSMTDPFWMVMVMRNIGPGFIVWDKAAEIDFVAPGRTSVTATFDLDEATLEELREAARAEGKVLRWFPVEVVDPKGKVIARVRKQIYVRHVGERATS